MNEEMNEQDVEQVESSPAEETNSEPNENKQSDSQELAPAAPPVEPKEQAIPFHRFKEVNEQKNRYLQELDQQRAQVDRLLAQLESQQKAAQGISKEEALFKKLERVDPDLAQVMRDTYSKAGSVDKVNQELSEFREWKNRQEAQIRAQEAYSSIDKLHGEFKVPKELQEMYVSQIKAIASENPSMGVADLPSVYKSVHDRINSYLESVRRQERASYLKAKKEDAKAPTSMAKGQAPGAAKPQYSANPEEAKAEMIKQIMKQSRAAKDI